MRTGSRQINLCTQGAEPTLSPGQVRVDGVGVLQVAPSTMTENPSSSPYPFWQSLAPKGLHLWSHQITTKTTTREPSLHGPCTWRQETRGLNWKDCGKPAPHLLLG